VNKSTHLQDKEKEHGKNKEGVCRGEGEHEGQARPVACCETECCVDQSEGAIQAGYRASNEGGVQKAKQAPRPPAWPEAAVRCEQRYH
jgi:hypothetical protein